MIKVYPFGKYCHRQPLAYQPIAMLGAQEITVTERPEDASILLLAHSKDLITHAEFLTDHLRKSPDKRLVLLSEEPFWDTIWGADPFTREQVFFSDFGDIPFTFLNHHTSDIFTFDQIPYYLLTHHRFAARYSLRFGKNAQRSKADWQAHFRQAPIQAAFIAEKRLNEKFAVRFPAQDTYGLCRFRSQITQAYQTGTVYRGGLGWRKGALRQELPDWHLDKLLTLDRRCRFISALENTHQPQYLSEKLFDAFAMGAVPLFYASPAHRLNQLVPEGAWINLYGLTPSEAVQAIDNFDMNDDFLAAYVEAQQHLAQTFETPTAMMRERDRLRRALGAALAEVCPQD